MLIAVGDGMEGEGVGGWRSWKFYDCSQDWLDEDVGAVGGEFGAGEFDWQLRAFGDIVERYPGDVMLDRVGVGDAGADADFYLVG